MQEIVTLACEKWAAGDKVSVVFCCLQILKYWSYRPLSRFCKNTFTLNQKLLRHFLKNFLLLILFLNLYLFFLNFWHCLALWLKLKLNKTEVTSVKLVLFKSVMSFETLTKVDRLTEIVRTRPGLTVVLSSV